MRNFRETNNIDHMQVCLWPFYFVYLNPGRIQIVSGHLGISFRKIVMKLVLQRCMLFPEKVYDSGLWAASMFGLGTYDDSYIRVFSMLTKLWVTQLPSASTDSRVYFSGSGYLPLTQNEKLFLASLFSEFTFKARHLYLSRSLVIQGLNGFHFRKWKFSYFFVLV